MSRSLQITLTLPAPLPPPPGPVVGLTLEAEETVLRADGASSTTITALVLTSTGDPAPDGTVVTFTTDHANEREIIPTVAKVVLDGIAAVK